MRTGLLLVLLAAAAGPAWAARIGGLTPSLLVVDQWLETNAQGLVLQSGLDARLRSTASTADGLSSDWSPALDHRLADAGLQLLAVPWQDPPLPAAGQSRSVPGTRAAVRLPANVAASRIARLSALAASQLQAAAPALAARLVARLQAAGASDAWFNFRQRLPVAGQPRQLSWTLHVAASGTWFAGTPAVDVPGTALLHVNYTARAPATGLPADYRYPDGGWLRWQLVDATGHRLPGSGARDTQGAFDGPAGLACLLGTAAAAACDAAQEGIAGLIERLGAAQADLTVAAALRPLYVVTAGGQRFALARLTIQRSLQGGDAACATPPWRFINQYQAAFLLSARLDHYQRSLSGSWFLQSSGTAELKGPLSPWKQLSVPILASQIAQLDQLAIDPDRGQLIRLDTFPAGLQQVTASAVSCQAAPGVPIAESKTLP